MADSRRNHIHKTGHHWKFPKRRKRKIPGKTGRATSKLKFGEKCNRFVACNPNHLRGISWLMSSLGIECPFVDYLIPLLAGNPIDREEVGGETALTANPVQTSSIRSGENRREGPRKYPGPSQDRGVVLTGLSYAAFSSRMIFRIFSWRSIGIYSMPW
jgi:hypothetical protein